MSEIQPAPAVRNQFNLGNNRSGEWRSLRLLVYRTRGLWLTAGLVETSFNGIERLDGRIAGLQVAWDPALCVGDLRLYALQQALEGVAQTRL